MLLAVALGCWSCAKAPEHRAREAMLLADAGQARQALELLERHLAKQPRSVLERRLAVRLSGSVGDLGRAERHAAALARELGPNSPQPLLELGHALELTHHYVEALDHYDRAAALAPRDPAGPLTGGLRAAAWGEPELAEPRLAEAVRRDPADARAWHALGLVRARLGDLEAAERAYRSGLTADPRGSANRVGLATLALLRDDPRAVLVEYDALLAEQPGFADAHLGRSWALVRLRRFAEASRSLERAERLGADRASLAKQRQWLHAEEAKARATRPEGAATP
jgi:tetratricopeptide (TPR) repeat protein